MAELEDKCVLGTGASNSAGASEAARNAGTVSDQPICYDGEPTNPIQGNQKSHVQSEKIEKIRLTDIIADRDLQSRIMLCEETLKDYTRNYSDGDPMPPVVAFRDSENNLWLVDGFHRIEAAQAAGMEYIPCEIRKGDRRAAIFYGVGANARHGLRRTTFDKRRAVLILLQDSEWRNFSDRKIAEICSVSHTFVSSVRNSAASQRQHQNRLKSSRKTLAKAMESDSTSAGNIENQESSVILAGDSEKIGTSQREDYSNLLSRVQWLKDRNESLERDIKNLQVENENALQRIKELQRKLDVYQPIPV